MRDKRGELRSFSGLQLPLGLFTASVTFLFDECWSPSAITVSLTRAGLNVVTVHDVHLAGAEDRDLADYAMAVEGNLVTRDYNYIKHVVSTGGVPGNVIWVRDLTSDNAALPDTNAFGHLLKMVADLTKLQPEKRFYAYYFGGKDYVLVEEYPPPPEMCRLAAELLKARRGLSSADLANIWGITVRSARRRAQKLADAGWIRIVTKGRQHQYFCGDRLLRFLELPRSLQEEVRSLTENENSPRNRASAMRTFGRHCLQ